MTITDLGLRPYPVGDSSIRRMALEARGLGYDSLVAVGVPPGDYYGVAVREGIIIAGMPAKDAAAKAKRAADGRLVMVRAGDNGFNRAMIGVRGVHLLCGIEYAHRHAFDHVIAKMAADNTVAVDISLAPLILRRGPARQKALDRYRDILMLSRKFSFPLTLSTHADSVLSMRSVREVSGLAATIGFDLDEIEQALAFAGSRHAGSTPVREVP
ncbi:MAG TPA: RNase P subunit p30 family protein [Methanoregulaceae archaeon]|nr:RNase P subunit p30 family protein [Methanoregulaceae archaeon]HPD74969.1 RNase P subunit p30 family protein [Methanoregulaceae archaeon]HRY75202.1 RNase P subunit p30 family protein [Methanoregulaceae archaeon]